MIKLGDPKFSLCGDVDLGNPIGVLKGIVGLHLGLDKTVPSMAIFSSEDLKAK